MALLTITEFFILFAGVYYLYYLIKNYSTIKNSPKLSDDYKSQFFYSLFGAIGIILSFQVYWLTEFYERHPFIEIVIKIILGIFSIVNQMLIYDLEKDKNKIKKKKKDDDYYYFSDKSEKRWGFKLINRLYLLNIVFKLFYRNKLKNWKFIYSWKLALYLLNLNK